MPAILFGMPLSTQVAALSFRIFFGESKKEKSIPIYTESIVLPVLPLLPGLYCFYIAAKIPSLIIELESHKHTPYKNLL
jgi:hypothetical protein